MNKLNKIAAAVALALGLAATASAHPMGGNMGHGAQQGGHQQQGMQGHGGQNRMEGMKHGRMQGMKHGESHAGHGTEGGQSLMTPDERTALREKMRNAKTPEERQQIALANRAEMEKRAAEKGITLPEHRGPRGKGTGPAAGEHKH